MMNFEDLIAKGEWRNSVLDESNWDVKRVAAERRPDVLSRARVADAGTNQSNNPLSSRRNRARTRERAR